MLPETIKLVVEPWSNAPPDTKLNWFSPNLIKFLSNSHAL